MTLYHASGNAQHCLVEVCSGFKRAVVDPTYGNYFVKRNGEPVSLEELQGGIEPRFRFLPGSDVDHYPRNEYYNFVFQHTKTANWTKSRMRRTAYRLATTLTSDRINRLRLPPFLEWPQIVLTLAVIMSAIVLDLVLVIITST